MGEPNHQLVGCLIAVFPNLDETEVEAASMDTVKEWDSLKMITLIVLIEEEFEIEVPVDDIENLTSYQALQNLLEKQLKAKMATD